jgi:protein-L-isoaspartate(D-aspartate) O-methyltransferase
MAWWLVPQKKSPMRQDGSVEERRRRYAAEIARSGGIHHSGVEEAFASVPRENYLTPPPWTTFAPGGLLTSETSDAGELYQDVLVVLDRERGINNGQPSLHAAWLAAIDPKPGDTAVHIGAGTGYYTALLAALVAPGGRVHAYEIVEHLAEIARCNLECLDCVTVHAVSGVAPDLPEADIVYVNASASAPDHGWLKALKPGGRLIFPWQPPKARSGVTFQVTRTAAGYRARALMEVAFISCIGATTPASEGRADVDEVMHTRSIWLTKDRPPDDSALLVSRDIWFSRNEI